MKKWTLLIAAIVLLGSLAGCASNMNNGLPSPSPMDTLMPADTGMMPLDTLMPGASPDPLIPGMTTPGNSAAPNAAATMTSAEASQLAKRISDEVVKLSEVDKATTVVMGNTALIGVNFESQYRGEMTTRIKDMVLARAKSAAPVITKAVVSADPDLIKRIEALFDKIAAGASPADIAGEFTEIVNRIMPA